MQHCVASYTEEAIEGKCYLFHVEHAGAAATVEVGWNGKVWQANGPRNQQNAAAQWGRRVLGRWGKDVMPALRRQYPDVVLGPDRVPF